MTRPVVRLPGGGAAAPALAVLALAVLVPNARGAWVETQWLAEPVPDPAARLGPVAVAPSGAVAAIVRAGAAPGAATSWEMRTRAPGASWTAAPAPLGVPAGLVPLAAEGGTVLAAGVVATPHGAVVAAARGGAAGWGPVQPLSAPLADGGAGAGVTGAVGADGTAAVAWREGGTARVAVLDEAAVVPLAGAGAEVPVVRIGAAGDVLALWTRPEGTAVRLVGALRPAGGRWTPVRALPTPRGATAAQLHWDGDVAGGAAIVAWTAGARTGHRVQWSIAPRPGARWTSPAAATPALPGARLQALRATAGGDAVVLWSTTGATASATRPAGAAGWTPDGTLTGAPGRGRAARAPLQVVATPLGTLHAVWPVRGGVAVSTRDAHAPVPWPAADVVPAAPGPLAVRAAAADTGDLAVSWAVLSGVGTGRIGAAVRTGPAGPAPQAARAAAGPDGPVLRIRLAAPSRVGVEVLPVTRAGAADVVGRRPVAAVLLDLPAGASAVPLPRLVTDRLLAGRRYALRVRTPGRTPAVVTPPVTLPR